MSLCLPLILGLAKVLKSEVAKTLVFMTLWLGSIGGAFYLSYSKNLGGSIAAKTNDSIAVNEQFFAEVFMNPLFQCSSFLFGIMLSLVYSRYRADKLDDNIIRDSSSSRAIELVCNNNALRYVLYAISFFLIAEAVLWQTNFAGTPDQMSQLQAGLYASLAPPIFLLGLSMMVMPALGGKAALFRFFFGSQTWTILSSVAIGMYFCAPMVALFYFVSSQH